MRSVELRHTVHSSIRIDTLTEKQQLPFFVGMTAAVVSLDEKKRKRFIHCTLHIVHCTLFYGEGDGFDGDSTGGISGGNLNDIFAGFGDGKGYFGVGAVSLQGGVGLVGG